MDWPGLRLMSPFLTEEVGMGLAVKVELDLCCEIWIQFKYTATGMEGALSNEV